LTAINLKAVIRLELVLIERISGVSSNFSRGGFSKFLYGKNLGGGGLFGIFSQKHYQIEEIFRREGD